MKRTSFPSRAAWTIAKLYERFSDPQILILSFQTREEQKNARLEKEKAKAEAERAAKEAREKAEEDRKANEVEEKAAILSGSRFY